MKWHFDEMTLWWNDKLMKWQVDEMTCWWNDSLMKCQVDEMTGWWNDKFIKWQVDEMTCDFKGYSIHRKINMHYHGIACTILFCMGLTSARVF